MSENFSIPGGGDAAARVRAHYQREARQWKDSKQATMKDMNIKDAEVANILYWLEALRSCYESADVLEIGCGNGYTAAQIEEAVDVRLTAIDFCEEFIDLCRERKLARTRFAVGDALGLEFDDESFDIVFTQRTLMNLACWETQKKALAEILRVLRRGGSYLMIESFTDGLEALNQAQEAVGLEPKRQPHHNCYFDKAELFRYMEGRMERFRDERRGLDSARDENFLSSYFFGSRVLYPALIKGRLDVVYNNKFVEFFRHMPAYGNYSTIQLFVFRKL